MRQLEREAAVVIIGGGIMASFPSAVSTVQAALAIQRELVGSEVRVRVGLNAGEPIAEEDDLFGTAVQLARRITDRAEPGQVLVSNVVRELCAGKDVRLHLGGRGDAHGRRRAGGAVRGGVTAVGIVNEGGSRWGS